jgi:hypothetical protein
MKKIIQFQAELQKNPLYFLNEQETINYLRHTMNVDNENKLSDDFILSESYHLNEWKYIKINKLIKTLNNESKKRIK